MSGRVRVSHVVPLLALASLVLFATTALADVGHKVVPMPWFSGSWALEFIVTLFLVNILLNILLLMVPIFILSFFDYEKEVSSDWIWAIPMISVVGAYIDAGVFYYETIPMAAGLLLIGLSFFMVVTMYLRFGFRTGLVTCSFAVLMNMISWTGLVDFSGLMMFGLLVIGTVYVILLTLLFLRNSFSYVTRDPSFNRKKYPGQVISFSITIFLIMFALIYI